MHTIHCGVALPYGSARTAARLAQLAEECGWEGVFLGDAVWCEDPMICLTAAAMVTRHIRLGTMIIPAPLRRPWKIASEAVALDRLSDGRLILGLGAGAVWMGWQAFPDEVQEKKARAEILDETIDILSLLFSRRQADYSGKHFHLKLSQLDPLYYPPAPVQQPRIPLWVPGHWPRPRSMERAARADGIFPEKLDAQGQPGEVTPQDLKEMCAFIFARRAPAAPYDVVASGQTGRLTRAEQAGRLSEWAGAGATWWVEALFELDEAAAEERIRQGPPG